MSIPALMEAWFQKCYILLSASCVFIYSAVVLGFSALMAPIRKKRTPMVLPVTTPTFMPPGILKPSSIFPYGGVRRLSAGFAQASRVARNRLAIYGESSLFEAESYDAENQASTSPKVSWVEHIPELYMSSISTFDNTTISASISLESRSVYSISIPPATPHTPTIMITVPSANDFGSNYNVDDGSDYLPDSEDEYQSESPNRLCDDVEDIFSTSKPALGGLACRRGFPGLPIVTSFPHSDSLLSPLSIFSPTPRTALEPAVYEILDGSTTDIDSLSSPDCNSVSDSLSPSTLCDDEDTLYQAVPSKYAADVYDPVISTTDELILDTMDTSELCGKHNGHCKGMGLGLDQRLGSYVPIFSTSCCSLTPGFEIYQNYSMLTTSLDKHNLREHVSPSGRLTRKIVRRLSATEMSANRLIGAKENADNNDCSRFSFPCYITPRTARNWAPAVGPASATMHLLTLPEVFPPSSVQDIYQLSVPETTSVVFDDSFSIGAGLLALSADGVSQCFDGIPQSELPSNNCGLVTKGPVSISGNSLLSMDISISQILPANVDSMPIASTEMVSFDRGRAVRAWISMVDPGFDSDLNGSMRGPSSVHLVAYNEEGSGPRQFQNGVAKLRAPPQLSCPTPRLVSSPASLSARAQSIAIEPHRSSVIYSSQHRALDLPGRTTLRPLMLPLRLAFRDALGKDTSFGSVSSTKEELSASFVDHCESTTHESTSKLRSSSFKRSPSPLKELLHALDLSSSSDNILYPKLDSRSGVKILDSELEPAGLNHSDNLPSDSSMVVWGIAI